MFAADLAILTHSAPNAQGIVWVDLEDPYHPGTDCATLAAIGDEGFMILDGKRVAATHEEIVSYYKKWSCAYAQTARARKRIEHLQIEAARG